MLEALIHAHRMDKRRVVQLGRNSSYVAINFSIVHKSAYTLDTVESSCKDNAPQGSTFQSTVQVLKQ